MNIEKEEEIGEENVPEMKSVRARIVPLLIAAVVIAAVGGTWYVIQQQKYIYTEKSEITALIIKLTSHEQGVF